MASIRDLFVIVEITYSVPGLLTWQHREVIHHLHSNFEYWKGKPLQYSDTVQEGELCSVYKRIA